MATDPRVSRAKFAREVDLLRQNQDANSRLGIWLLSAEYPEVVVAFATPKPTHVTIPFAVLVDFTDYDARPLKVTLVHPCTRKPLKANEILPQLFQGMQINPPPRIVRLRQVGLLPQEVTFDAILQAFEQDDDKPFLCLPGVRAYHDNAAHTGDSWWLHRKSGEGSLYAILNTLWKYGAKNVLAQQFTLQPLLAGTQMETEIQPLSDAERAALEQALPQGLPPGLPQQFVLQIQQAQQAHQARAAQQPPAEPEAASK